MSTAMSVFLAQRCKPAVLKFWAMSAQMSCACYEGKIFYGIIHGVAINVMDKQTRRNRADFTFPDYFGPLAPHVGLCDLGEIAHIITPRSLAEPNTPNGQLIGRCVARLKLGLRRVVDALKALVPTRATTAALIPRGLSLPKSITSHLIRRGTTTRTKAPAWRFPLTLQCESLTTFDAYLLCHFLTPMLKLLQLYHVRTILSSAGTGTVGLVCKRHGRDFVGVELSDKYVALARERLARPVTLSLLKEA